MGFSNALIGKLSIVLPEKSMKLIVPLDMLWIARHGPFGKPVLPVLIVIGAINFAGSVRSPV